MNIPDILIECARCTKSAPLAVSAVQQDTAGVWRPINARRPSDWIVWPGAPLDPTQGICPQCLYDWSASLARFLVVTPTDAAITLRNPPPPEAEPRRANSIPIPATPISVAQFIPAESTIPNAQHHAPRTQNATTQATLPTFVAAPPSRSTIMASPIPNAAVQAAPISTRNQAVHVSANASVRLAAPARVQKIALPAPQVVTAAPISTPIPHTSAPINSSPSMITTSAPQPIQQNSGGVTYEAQPIEPEPGDSII